MILLGIGSNLSSKYGDRFTNIDLAISFLEAYKINVIKKSSYYETPSYPDNKNPKFINVVIQSNSKIPPKKLIEIFKKIEWKLGRVKSFKNSPRTCDIDIISYRNKVLSKEVTIPHKRMSKRNFVLLPLFEIAPNWIHPKTNKTIKRLIFSLPIKDITTIKHI